MDALLLSAGFGKRLRPFTDVLPKCLMPIWGRPLLGIWLEMLVGQGIKTIHVNLHYLAPLVREYIENSPYNTFVNFLDEPELMGTAGSINFFRDAFTSDDLLVAHADNLTFFDVAAFQHAYHNRPKECAMTMMTFETDDPASCGIVTLADDIVVKFVEKSPDESGTLANGAVYIFDLQTLFRHFDMVGPISDISTQVLPHFVGRMNTFLNQLYHRDIGNVGSLMNAQLELKEIPAAQDVLERVDGYWTDNRSDTERKFRAVAHEAGLTKPGSADLFGMGATV